MAIRGGDLTLPDGFKPIRVVVLETRKMYEVRLKDFVKWLDREGTVRRK